MSYSINEHTHRFAAWAASRAAATSKKCRFSVNSGKLALESCDFNESYTIDDLPDPAQFDNTHKIWREKIIKTLKCTNDVSDGVAAKLINTYLKGRFICGGFHEHDKAKALHPPLDSLLLNELKRLPAGNGIRELMKDQNRGWSGFDSPCYQGIVNIIRQILGDGKPLWMIEEYWRGYR